MRPLPLALYAAATALAEPLAPWLLRARARKGKEDPARIDERMGRSAMARPDGPLVWRLSTFIDSDVRRPGAA